MARIAYTKSAKNYADQVKLLRQRGLELSPEKETIRLLKTIGYYRLSGYWYPLLKDPKTEHRFKTHSSFQNVLDIYRFDRDLRFLILQELEKIEIAVRAQMIYTLSQYCGEFWHIDSTLFSNPAEHEKMKQVFEKLFQNSDEEFIRTFKSKYADVLPPCWMMLELVSFGSLSVLYKNLKPGKIKREIAHEFALDDSTLASWLHSLVYIRNICAHHSRLWNRGLKIRPQIPLVTTKQWLEGTRIHNNRLYFILSMILYLLQSIDDKYPFLNMLGSLHQKYSDIYRMAMGFPINWEKERLWC